MKFTFKTRKEQFVKIVLFLFGFISLSPWSSEISLKILHLPLAMPELLGMPFLLIFYRIYQFNNIFKSKSFVSLIILWLLLISLGIFYYPLFDILSAGRTYLYLFLTYLLFYKSTNFQIYDAVVVCIGGLVGWLTLSFSNYKLMAFLNEIVATIGPMLPIPIIIGYFWAKQSYKILIVFIVLSILTGIFSTLRRELVIVGASVIIASWIIAYISNKKEKYQIIRFYIILISSLVITYPIVKEIVKNEAPWAYSRIFVKSETLVSGELGEGDDTRGIIIRDWCENIYKYIIPQGIVSKQTSRDSEVGRFYDFPMIELSTTFGLFGALALICYFSLAAFIILRKVKKHVLPRIYIIFPLTMSIILICILFEGSSWSLPYCAPYTGYILGRLQFLSNLKIKFNE